MLETRSWVPRYADKSDQLSNDFTATARLRTLALAARASGGWCSTRHNRIYLIHRDAARQPPMVHLLPSAISIQRHPITALEVYDVTREELDALEKASLRGAEDFGFSIFGFSSG